MRLGALALLLLRAMADEDHFEVRRVQYGRQPLGPDQLFFKPCLVYQRLLDEHVVDAGLELRARPRSLSLDARRGAPPLDARRGRQCLLDARRGSAFETRRFPQASI